MDYTINKKDKMKEAKQNTIKTVLSYASKVVTIVVVIALAVAGAVLLGQITIPDIAQYAIGYGLLLSAIVYLAKNLK